MRLKLGKGVLSLEMGRVMRHSVSPTPGPKVVPPRSFVKGSERLIITGFAGAQPARSRRPTAACPMQGLSIGERRRNLAASSDVNRVGHRLRPGAHRPAMNSFVVLVKECVSYAEVMALDRAGSIGRRCCHCSAAVCAQLVWRLERGPGQHELVVGVDQWPAAHCWPRPKRPLSIRHTVGRRLGLQQFRRAVSGQRQQHRRHPARQHPARLRRATAQRARGHVPAGARPRRAVQPGGQPAHPPQRLRRRGAGFPKAITLGECFPLFTTRQSFYTYGAVSTQFVPWNSIRESLVDYGQRRLRYPEGLASPCVTCRSAPCCTHLRVQTFRAAKLMELDLARYLLNFERIELGLSPEGEWSVYYAYPCRFLNRQDFTCTVHSTPRQPQVCVTYNPYNCFYKEVFANRISPQALRIDRQRLEYLLSQVVVDDDRNIVEMPNWDGLQQAFAQLEPWPAPAPTDPPVADPVTREWERQVITLEQVANPDAQAHSFASLSDPCQGCQAYCCTHLVFSQPTPQNISNLDFFRYCLGFSG